MNSDTSKLRYKTVQSAITNHWEYFKIEEDKQVKLSELVKNFPDTFGCFRKETSDGVLSDSLDVDFEEPENLTEYVLAVEFDMPFYFKKENDNLQLVTYKTKEDGSIESWVLAQNIFGIKFVNCTFHHQFGLRNDLKLLHFENCVFEKRCYINNQYDKNEDSISIEHLLIKKTKFNQNFKLHHVSIGKFYMEDSDFVKNADFYKSHFKSGIDENLISFHAINFHELALFGEAIFDNHLQFKYVTFKGYTHFRATEFNDGLDLEYANIEKEMNFFGINNLDTKKSKDKTSQETFRIVKYQLEKVGNIIDANKYAALELSKKRITSCEDCESFYSLLDCIVLSAHKITSDYSKNWLWTLCWIIMISLLTIYFLNKDINSINDIFQYMSILNNFEQFKYNDKEKINYFVLLFNKVLLGYLYYQFLISIRKNKRK